MPEWFDVLILALIEGITEFLPISSTGHMLLAEHFLRHPQSEVFLAVVQMGAVLAVILVFTTRIRDMLTKWHDPKTRDFTMKLIVAFCLTAAGGLALKKIFHFKLPENTFNVAMATLVGGILILLIEGFIARRKGMKEITWVVAIAIGVGQLLAVIFPGLSRSGTTIMIGLALGTTRPAATEFSFLLGIPTLLAAGGMEILQGIKHPEITGVINWKLVLFGTAVAAVTAFLTVRWLLHYIQSHTFVPFGWYRIVLGIAMLGLLYFEPHFRNSPTLAMAAQCKRGCSKAPGTVAESNRPAAGS
jgi:undecaprenyl-diphosphatase